ncbi:MAG: ABC transporter ATP-binding protein [Actinobacteria bacterium]|nr:ABC transporter ATP-binding protein [Actinomycetota bacterium]MBS1884304.1 ABC transporter ATP-binding protein [Actinomycetota bacterium]
MSVDEELTTQPAVPGAPGPDAPPAIRVEDLHKSFRIPTQRVDSLKERAVHPFAAREYRELQALDGVSFEIRQGEFFGIVGRNGSGKSTLLKLLASIYRADSGRIQIAGRLAPFIELGVGFNQELTARENVVLNGVMMGLTPKEVRERQDAVIDFAELHDFADLKIKNYSSGMLVRLAFSVMLQADADVLLIDEVLAVGDASFQQKCADAFHQMKAEGKTIVLVTHDMAAVEQYCHRAMLLADGNVQFIGDPAEAGRDYLKLNFEAGLPQIGLTEAEADGARLLDCSILDSAGAEVANIESREDIRVRVELELLRETASAVHVGFVLATADGLGLLEFGEHLRPEDQQRPYPAGSRFTLQGRVENRLAPGRYFLNCGVTSAAGISIYVEQISTFVVFGTTKTGGVIAPEVEFQVESEEPAA